MTTAPNILKPNLNYIVPIRFGMTIIVALMAITLGWGVLTQISGAVVASGRVAVESGQKKIQNKEGGIVSELLVKEGQSVKSGDIVARLDATSVGAYNETIQTQIWQMRAKKYRLDAEAMGAASMTVPTETSLPLEFRTYIQVERNLFIKRRSVKFQQQAQLNEQIIQSQKDIEGMNAQLYATNQQYELIDGELKAMRKLYEQGFAPLTRVNALQREAERLIGARGEITASIDRAGSQILASKAQLGQLDSQYLDDVMTEMSTVMAQLGKLEQEHIASSDTLKRVELRAPVSGKVQQISVHTQGGVIGAGEVLMVIVPDSDVLVIEALIDPRRIDQVAIGAKAHIRFTAFDATKTPEEIAYVDSLTSDVEVDTKTGASFYRARLNININELSPLVRQKLMAGMPVEVQIETTKRTALSYLLKPLTDHLERTFIDD